MHLDVLCLGLILGIGGIVFPAAYSRFIALRGAAWGILWVALGGAWAVATGYALYYAEALSLFGFCLCILPILTLFVGGLAVVVSYQPYVLLMGDHPEDRRAASRYRLMSLICAPVLVALQLAPLPLAVALSDKCSTEHREVAERWLIPALEAYRRDHGEYPDGRMRELVPAYLADEPWVPCAEPARRDAGYYQSDDGNRLGDFGLGVCYFGRKGEHFLYYRDMGAEVFSLSTNTWCGFDALDGPAEEACRTR